MFAQEPVTFSNDRFSGISSVGFSPTQPYFNENPWDANLFAVDVFVQNNYVYISQQSVLGLTKGEVKTASIKNGISGENTPNVMDFFNENKGTYHFSADVLGPSVSFSTKINQKKYTFGIFTRQRIQGSAIDLDNYLNFNNQGIDPPENYQIKPLKTNLMNWGEIGINASSEIFPYSEYQWILGVNLKYELGFDAVNVDSKDFATLTATQESEDAPIKTQVSNYNIEASYATSYDFNQKKYDFSPKGKGLGIDIGLAFVNQNKYEDTYDFKMSFNILDIGYLNFDGEKHLLNGTSFDFDSLENDKIENPQHFFHFVSEKIYGDENASLVGNSFTIGLPTSFHFNASKKIRENHFLNFDFVQRTPVFENSLKRSNITNISYTIQKRAFGIGVSTSLYEYKNLQFGGYIRVGPLILGSENAFPFVFKHPKLHGADFYIGLKLYPFWDDDLARRRRSKCDCD